MARFFCYTGVMRAMQQLIRRWVLPGLGVKRWFLLLLVGAALMIVGLGIGFYLATQRGGVPIILVEAVTLAFLPGWARIWIPVAMGAVLFYVAGRRLVANLVAPFRRDDEAISESLYRYHSRRGRGPSIVAIGGGSGLPSLLRGLSQNTTNITAIVTMADDGGSSGRLRRELGLLPPGDLRSNMAALAADEALMTQLLRFRFGRRFDDSTGVDSEISGHNFGNLLLAALTGITGSFDEALLAAERVLAVRGRVLPSTIELVTLLADVVSSADGTLIRVEGESEIPKAAGQIRQVYLAPADAAAYPPALKAIFQADLIVLGPGSLYTSIIPNLLVPEIRAALEHTRAPIVYVCNLVTQPGETDGYTVADHVRALTAFLPAARLLTVLANSNLKPGDAEPANSAKLHYNYVRPVPAQGVHLTTLDLVDPENPERHDSVKLARAVLDILARGL